MLTNLGMLNTFQPNEKCQLEQAVGKTLSGDFMIQVLMEAGRLSLEVYPGWVESNIAVIYYGDVRNVPVIEISIPGGHYLIS